MHTDDFLDAANQISRTALATVDATLLEKECLELLKTHREAVLGAMVICCLTSFHFILKLQGDNRLKSLLEEPGQKTIYGKCTLCHAPFLHPKAAHIWVIGGNTTPLCQVCSDRNSEPPRKQ